MEPWAAFNEMLRAYVNPATFPVAVSLLGGTSQIPKRAKRPKRDLKVQLAPCQGAAMARRYGWTMAFTHEDVGCAIAAHTYGWERTADPKGAIYFLTRMNYVADEEAARSALTGLPRLELGDEPVVVYSPLDRTETKPHVILIYANPAQVMRLIHGTTYHTGQPIESRFSGRAASCTEGVIGAFNDKQVKVVVPGNGDRVWGTCQDHEMVISIPAERLESVVEGLEKTHQRGIRYPIPSYMKYQPEVGLAIPLAGVFNPDMVDRLLGPKKA
jgi:uncharacterized protein (DUF169 family)